MLDFDKVIFVGGPRDGLTLVGGIENFSLSSDIELHTYAVANDNGYYLSRQAVEDRVLYLDYQRESPSV